MANDATQLKERDCHAATERRGRRHHLDLQPGMPPAFSLPTDPDAKSREVLRSRMRGIPIHKIPVVKISDSQAGWQSEREDGTRRDRTKLSSTQLYQLAARGEIQLSQAEKDRVSPDYLFVLAITKNDGLNQRDKDRLRPLHLAHLAVMEKMDLSPEDKRRLPTNSAVPRNSNFKWTCD